jgi:hypothetical protein
MNFLKGNIHFLGIFIGIIFLLLLKFGILDQFFFTGIVGNKGIDYFALPKGFLNLLEGRSIFDTWGGTAFGPYATWYIAHPTFAVMIMPFFSIFPTWISYWLFVVFSMVLMLISAYFFTTLIQNYWIKALFYFVLICTFPTYLMLYVGNMHAPVILALSFLFIAIYLIIKPIEGLSYKWFFIIAMIVSLFTKPVVLIMFPVFLIIEKTRKLTIYIIGLYILISFLFIIFPLFNPEGVGISNLFSLTVEHLQNKRNIYTNGFNLTPLMKDNIIHWINLISMSDYYFKHIEIFGFATFCNDILGFDLPKILYKLPVIFSVFGAFALYFTKENNAKYLAVLFLIMSISLTVFISYNLVWEYQYASVTPVFVMIIILFLHQNISKHVFYLLAFFAVWFYLPSPFFIFNKSNNWSVTSQNLLHASRALPVFIVYCTLYFLFVKQIILSKKNYLFS